MTLARYAEAVKNNEPRYYVEATTSRSLTRAFSCKKTTLMYGPYIIERNAKRKARSLRKDRVLVMDIATDEVIDLGPSFREVSIRTEL
jgi:hypothetical protein